MSEQLKLVEHFVDVETFSENFPELKIVSVQRICEGFNSQVYRLESQNKEQFLAKFYFCHPSDPRDRLGTEFFCLSTLWKEGIRSIPQPLAINKSLGCAVYEYINGRKILAHELTSADIDECVRFLERLKMLANKSHQTAFQPASEACFSFQDIVDNIEWRLKRLKVPASKHENLRLFLINDFKPFLGILVQWYKQKSSGAGDDQISFSERTLSPSDFGFHNAFKKTDGGIVFLDFEYFGWDDPAKMISDFLLHPAMSLSRAMKERFLSQISNSSVFCDKGKLLGRVKLVYPFFGIKWCLILLNEFISDDLQRRYFAQSDLTSKENLKQRQLLKAQTALASIKETYKNFSFYVK